MKKRKSELLDDEIGEYSQAANNQVSNQDEHHTAPNQGILEGFDHLIFLVFFILNTRLIVSNSFNHQTFIIFRKAFGRKRTIGKENADNDGPDARKETEYQKQKLPVFNRAICEMGDTKA